MISFGRCPAPDCARDAIARAQRLNAGWYCSNTLLPNARTPFTSYAAGLVRRAATAAATNSGLTPNETEGCRGSRTMPLELIADPARRPRRFYLSPRATLPHVADGERTQRPIPGSLLAMAGVNSLKSCHSRSSRPLSFIRAVSARWWVNGRQTLTIGYQRIRNCQRW